MFATSDPQDTAAAGPLAGFRREGPWGMLDAVPGIDRIRIQGFGCIEDVELELGPLQAFIGPNDSGKSTILRAVAVVRTKGDSGSRPVTPAQPTIGSRASALPRRVGACPRAAAISASPYRTR